MPITSIRAPKETSRVTLPPPFSGSSSCTAYFDSDDDPLHLHLHALPEGETLRIGQSEIDRLAYVWKGVVSVKGEALGEGSSLIVEHGTNVEIVGGAKSSVLLTFAASATPEQSKKGGHVHLLPVENVPRCESESGVKGGMHADSDCPTCELWLHENHFAGAEASEEPTEKSSEVGIHAHSEDEIIFVTAGEIRFGNKVGGPGTALAIPANAFYSFNPGRYGLSFINFRAHKPSDIRFKNGAVMSETGYWKNLVPRPQYVDILNR